VGGLEQFGAVAAAGLEPEGQAEAAGKHDQRDDGDLQQGLLLGVVADRGEGVGR